MRNFALLNPWLLLLLGILVPIYLLLRRQEHLQEAARSLLNTDSDILPKAYTLRLWKILGALALIVLGLSRPAHSPTPRAISQGGRDIIFALDVSRSMLAEDAKPSRLEKAKSDIKNCIANNPGARVGLVAFAGSANVKVPLTMDHEFFRLAVDEAGPGTVAQGSTFLQAAFDKIVDRLMDEERLGYQDLILLTDGEDQGSNEEKVVASLQDTQLRLMVLGYGDSTIGARIPVRSENGETTYMVHEGYDVWTRLEEPRLHAIARAGEDGQYFNATRSDFLLANLYREWAAEAPLQPLSVDGDLIYKELYPLCFALAVLLLLPFPKKLSPGLASLMLSLLFIFPAMGEGGAGSDWQAHFADVSGHMGKGEWPEAMELISELAGHANDGESMAQCSTYQALCAAHMSDGGAAATERLSWAEQGIAYALESLLAQPRDLTTQRLLEGLAHRRVAALKALAKEKEDEEQTANILEEIVEDLRDVVEREGKLLSYTRSLLPPRPRRAPMPPPRGPYLPEQISEQGVVNDKTVGVSGKMKTLITMVTTMLRATENLPADLPVPTEFDGAYELIKQGDGELVLALPALKVLSSIRVAADHQNRGLNHLKGALALLEGQQNSGESEEFSDEDSEDYEDWGESYGEEGDLSSMPAMSGASRSDFVNRALPTPDYSVEDLLTEELENNVERAKKRAAQGAGVKKDW